jgi:hypothetical protein
MNPVPTGPRVDVEVTVVVTTAVVGTAFVLSAGTLVHVDALQIMPAGHWFPQMPQFEASYASS